MFVSKFGWNCTSGSKEVDENVKSLQRKRRQYQQITNKFWSEKFRLANNVELLCNHMYTATWFSLLTNSQLKMIKWQKMRMQTNKFWMLCIHYLSILITKYFYLIHTGWLSELFKKLISISDFLELFKKLISISDFLRPIYCYYSNVRYNIVYIIYIALN